MDGAFCAGFLFFGKLMSLPISDCYPFCIKRWRLCECVYFADLRIFLFPIRLFPNFANRVRVRVNIGWWDKISFEGMVVYCCFTY